MIRSVALYWGGVFALGFVLGVVRTLWLEPFLGALAAVAAELPVMLAASWVWAGRVLARHPLPTRGAALTMGLLAFALLLASELALAAALAGAQAEQTPREWAAALLLPAGALGLAGQAVFAVMPALRWQDRR